jgi:uncharacterized protein YggE
VIGSAESEFTPNIIVISVRLREYNENKERLTLEKIEADFMNALTKSNISKDNIRLADVSSNVFNYYRYYKQGVDFSPQKTYEVTFSKTEEVLAFLENLKGIKIDNLSIAKLSHTEIQKYRLETKVEALKASERKAETLLTSIGSKKGKVLLIEETEDLPEWQVRSLYSNLKVENQMYSVADDAPSGGDAPLKKIKLRYEIKTRFEIE